MPHRADPANGKARLRPDQRGIGLAQGLARQRAGLLRAYLVSACGQKQHRIAAGFSAKDDGFHDLVQVTAHRIGGLLGGARACGFNNGGRQPRLIQRAPHPCHAFAHTAVPPFAGAKLHHKTGRCNRGILHPPPPRGLDR